MSDLEQNIKEILEDETILNDVDLNLISELYMYLGFYIQDKEHEIQELDFEE